jgi:O-antigen ligase
MAGLSTVNGVDQAKLARLADVLVVAVAVSLPWSTSATAILVVLWLLALIPTLRWADIRRELATPAGGLPVLLVALGLAGMLWADVTLLERWKGFDSYLKLLMTPLLFVQYRRSDHGAWVFAGYVFSCVALLAATTVVMATPSLSDILVQHKVLVKSAATQSGEFVTCIFGLMFLARDAIDQRRWRWVLGFMVVMSAMLASILYVAIGRTALVIVLVLLILFAIRKLSSQGIMLVFSGAILVGIIVWSSSPYLRERTNEIWSDLRKYKAADTFTSSGERLVFWEKSLRFFSQAPAIGHGTGTIRSLYQKSAMGETGAAGEVSANPHNQTFAIGIQLGLVGVAVLWAMWIAHLLLFRGEGLAEWIGLVLVVQNIVGSVFNSHLFDFVQGWTYVIGVGVAGGLVLKGVADGRGLARAGARK